MLQYAYGDSLMSMSMFYHWYNAFQDDQESVVVDGNNGLVQLAMKFYKIQQLLLYKKTKESQFMNSHNVWTFLLVVHSLFCMTIHRWSVLYRWVPNLITLEQMAHHVAVCNGLHTWFPRGGETEFHNVITVDES